MVLLSIGTLPPHAPAQRHLHHPALRDATYFESQLKLVLDAEAEAFVKVRFARGPARFVQCAFLTFLQLMWRMLVFETLRQQL